MYRKDEVDATHSPMFHQVEGMVIDKGVTMADLKGTLNTVVEMLYGKGTKNPVPPPSLPLHGTLLRDGCPVPQVRRRGLPHCKGEGWIEILGCGMVHPKVLEMSGIDPNEYSGYAFGIGLERMVMGRFKIDDIRLFYENDVRFLHQF